jgi:hypothetical protein
VTEEDIREKLLSYCKKIKSAYQVDKEVSVTYKHIYVKGKKETILEIWCFKQDIAFYTPLFDRTIPYKEAAITFKHESLMRIKLEKDSAQHISHVGMPFLIIEVKAKQPNTHILLAYNQKVELIKSIFPYCKFMLCISGEISQRSHRHCLNFDKIVSIKDIDNIPASFCEDIKELIQKADEGLKLISR